MASARPGQPSELPYSESFLSDFEERFCYDRYCDPARRETAGTRFMSTGHTLVGIGEANDPFFMDADGGFLGRFRHQHFLLFLVAHFQRAALHMFSDRLVAAVSRLDIGDAGPTGSSAATSDTRSRTSCASSTATGSTRSPTRPRRASSTP